MPGANGRHGFTTSPNSSEELDSNHGTPATKLSAFSPNNSRETLKLSSSTGIVRSKVPPAFVLTQAQSNFNHNNEARGASSFASQDPFVSGPNLTATTRSSTDASKLSPVASAFTPQTFFSSSNESSVAFSEPSGGVTVSPRGFNNSQSKLPFFVPAPGRSVPRGLCSPPPGLPDPYGIPASHGYKTNNDFNVASVSTTAGDLEPSVDSRPVQTGTLNIGSFSTNDGTSRTLMVKQISETLSATQIEEFFSVGFYQCHM